MSWRRPVGPAGAEVLPHQRHRRCAERRAREITQGLPAERYAMGAAGFNPEAIDQAQEPELANDHRQAVKPGRHADPQEPTDQIETWPKQAHMELESAPAPGQRP